MRVTSTIIRLDAARGAVPTEDKGLLGKGSTAILANLLVLPLWLLSSGCMEMAFERSCITSEDCPPGQSCILGVCTDMPDFEVDVEIIPPTTSDHLGYSARAVDLDFPDALRITVPPPTVVRGRLLLDQEPYLGAARLSFAAEPDLLRSPRYSLDLREDTSQFELKIAGTMLEQARTEPIPYTVTASPIDAGSCCAEPTLPCAVPARMSGLRFRTDTDDLVLALPSDPTRIQGRVVTSEEDPVPVAGVRARALAADGSIHSLPVETDERGAFCLAIGLEKSSHEIPLTVRLGPTSTNPLLPTVEHELLVLAGETLFEIDLEIGDHGVAKEVHGRLLDQREEPVEGAEVTFVGDVASGGTFSATTTSDASGSFSVEILRGTYQVRAVPPARSKAAVTETSDFVVDRQTGAGPPPLFAEPLPDRPTLSGRVVGPETDRPPISEVEVIAQLETGTSDGVSRVVRFETLTDEDGRFALPLDPGTYRLHFRPPWFTELPWMLGPLEIIEIGYSRELGSVVLEEASVFDGKALGEVEGARTVPLADARVEVHARRRDSTYLLWEGRADDKGAFQVLLPRSLTGSVEASDLPVEPQSHDPW